MKKVLFTILYSIFTLLAPTAQAATFSGAAKSYYLVDFQSGQSIVNKAADDLMIPASMIKLMTADVPESQCGKIIDYMRYWTGNGYKWSLACHVVNRQLDLNLSSSRYRVICRDHIPEAHTEYKYDY